MTSTKLIPGYRIIITAVRGLRHRVTVRCAASNAIVRQYACLSGTPDQIASSIQLTMKGFKS